MKMGKEHKDHWLEEIKALKASLLCQAQAQMGNLETVDAQELGEVVDMIKDCFEMCKLEQEAKYYKTIIDAMEEKGEDKDNMRCVYVPQPYPVYMHGNEEREDQYYRDMDRDEGRMYYSERSGNGSRSNGGSTRSNGRGSQSGSSNSSSSSGGYDASARGNNARGGGTRGYSEYMNDPYADERYRDMNNWNDGHQYAREMPIEMRDKREGRSSMQRKHYMESKEMHKDKATQLSELEKYMQELTSDITEMIADASPEEKQYMEKKIQTLAEKIGNA